MIFRLHCVLLGVFTVLGNVPLVSAQTWIEFSAFSHPQQPNTVVVQSLLHYGGTTALGTQAQFSPMGIVVIVDDPTEGSETNPTGTPNPDADPPPQNGASDDEQAVATILVRKGYEGVVNQPGDQPDWPRPTDTNYLPPDGKYQGRKPDLRVQDTFFDVYSPETSTSPKSIADNVQTKTERQCDRIIIKLPDPPEGKTVDQVIDEIIVEVQKKRDTPDNGIRDHMEELIVVKPDGTTRRLFPNGGIR
jgi:hypothetical protein